MLHHTKPENFDENAVHVSSAYLEHDGEILFLQRASHKKIWPNQRWVPAWKVDSNESNHEALLREIFEETWIELTIDQAISWYKQTLFVVLSYCDIVYHTYHVKFDQKPEVKISDEHQAHDRVHVKKALELDLMEDEADVLKMLWL